jgi:simple sugar transport system permease protein
MATVLSGGKSYALRGAEHIRSAGSSAGSVCRIPRLAERCLGAGDLTALIVIALWFILNRHRFGEHVLFIGDSMPCRGSSASMWRGRRSLT